MRTGSPAARRAVARAVPAATSSTAIPTSGWPRAPAGQDRVAHEHGEGTERRQQHGGESDGVDRDEVHRGHHGAPPIALTTPAVTASTGPGSTPRTTTPTARTPRTTASIPRVSGVVATSGSGTSPTHTVRATRRA